MSIQTRYSCSKCGHTVSHYSKKGFESLHTNIGISLLECKNLFPSGVSQKKGISKVGTQRPSLQLNLF